MAIVNEIKCARCDRKYSGVRSRCPYCGARRIGRGKYSEGSDNATGKMLISVLILAVFTVAAGILLFSTPNDADARDSDNGSLMQSPEEEVESLPSVVPDPTPTPTPDAPETPVAPPTVTSIRIMFDGREMSDVSEPPGTRLDFIASLDPPGIEDSVDIQWRSSDPDSISVDVHIGNRAATIHWIQRGESAVTLTVSAGDMERTIPLRFR